MKKLLLVCAVMAYSLLPAKNPAAPAKSAAKNVCGIYHSNGGLLPFIKIYNTDGTFISFATAGISYNPSTPTVTGTYKVKSKSKLVETLRESSTMFQPGDKNLITYAQRDNMMELAFRRPDGYQARETWKCLAGPSDDAGRHKAVTTPMTGIWQMRRLTSDGSYLYLPKYKVLRADGTFAVINASGQAAEVTVQGRYEMDSVADYTEFVTDTSTDPDLLGRGNRIHCEFRNLDTLRVTFRMPGRQNDSVEEWVRILGR